MARAYSPDLDRRVPYARSVHRAGAPIVMQSEHGGLFTVPLLTGQEPSGPSVLQTPDGPLGREMKKEEID